MYRIVLTLIFVGFAFGTMELDTSKFRTDVCTECEQIVGTIHLVLSNNETEGAVLNALNQFCAFLPTEFQSICKDQVSLYGREMIDALVKYLATPSQLCTLIGLCNSSTSNQREAFEDLMHLVKVYANKGVKVFEIPNQLKGMDSCSACEFITDLVQTTLLDQPMRDFAKGEALKFCSVLPSLKMEECKAVVYVMEPRFYETLVKKYLNPITFCTGIEVCDVVF